MPKKKAFTTVDAMVLLAAKKAGLEKESGDRSAIAVGDRSPDLLDECLQHSDHEVAVVGLNQNARLYALVKQAIKRVNQGDYGNCLRCENPILPIRLAAIPWAEYCLNCQVAEDAMVLPDKGRGGHLKYLRPLLMNH